MTSEPEGLEWMIGEIKKAESIERLNFLKSVIESDFNNGFEYALPPHVESLRVAFAERKKTICSDHTNVKQ